MTLESGGSRWALPVRPAISQIAASVKSEMILSVLAFINLFASDLFQHFVQRSRVEGLVETDGVFLEQSRFLEEFDARVAALFAGAAVDVPNAKLFVSRWQWRRRAPAWFRAAASEHFLSPMPGALRRCDAL